MEVFRITLLSMLVYMAYVPYAATARIPIYGEVGAEITLTCPSWDGKPEVLRSWSRGRYDTNIPPEKQLIYKLQGTTERKGDLMYRDDMTFDEKTFAMNLTVTVNNDVSDNDYFTCVTYGIDNTFDMQEVLIFLQPVVTIETDRQPEEGVNITVTCSVERLYPNITSDQFKMTWGSREAQDTEFLGSQNEDDSMKYTLEKTKNLTKEDKGVKVQCTVTPKDNFGDVAISSMVLNITMVPDDPAPKTDRGSNVGAIVGGVIGGLAVVIIVVVIMVVIMKKRKPEKDTTRESAAKGIRTKTNKPVSEGLQSEGLMYADLDLVNQPTRHKVEHEGSKPPVTPRPVQEPTEYAQIDFDKLKIKNQRDEEDLSLSDKEDL